MIHLFKSLREPQMKPGQVIINRQINNADPAKDKTTIIYCGNLDSHRLAGIKAILEGKAHARQNPRKEARP